MQLKKILYCIVKGTSLSWTHRMMSRKILDRIVDERRNSDEITTRDLKIKSNHVFKPCFFPICGRVSVRVKRIQNMSMRLLLSKFYHVRVSSSLRYQSHFAKHLGGPEKVTFPFNSNIFSFMREFNCGLVLCRLPGKWRFKWPKQLTSRGLMSGEYGGWGS